MARFALLRRQIVQSHPSRVRGLKCKTFSKEGAVVYQDAVKTFQRGKQAVSQATKENAYLYARMAERWAQIRRDYGDTAYTAKDFAAAHPIYIGGTGSDVQFGQAMFDVRKSGTKTFEEFINKINDRKQKGKPANKLMFIGNSGVIYAEAQVVHATTPHHGHVLSAEQLDDIDAHIGSLQNAAISNEKDTAVFSGIPVLTHVKGKLGDYYVVIEIDDKGNTWFKTGFPGKAESIDNIIKTKIAEHSARILSHNAQGPSSQNKTAISLLSIQKELSNVNEKYKQAWHSNQVYQQGKIRGAFDSSTGAIHLFDAADQSSFIHESAHMYLTEMERMVQEEEAPKQLVEDWHTIQDWASYAGGRLDDYKGTRLEKEFAGYETAIRKARESGDTVAIKAAEERWMQERFARAFERYIAEGKAPVKELQGPFRRFKNGLSAFIGICETWAKNRQTMSAGLWTEW